MIKKESISVNTKQSISLRTCRRILSFSQQEQAFFFSCLETGPVMSLLDLPDAVFCRLLGELLPVQDALSFGSSCKRLHTLLQEDFLVWKTRCSKLDVQNLDDWKVESFRTLYQKLLHPYAPLLGCWAGLIPIVGCIATITLDPPCIRCQFLRGSCSRS